MKTPTFKPAMTIVLSFTLCFLGCGSEEIVEEILRPVRYQTVFSTGGERVRTFSGVAQAGLESRLSFKVGGTITELGVKVGDQVKAGQTIARLDNSDFQLGVQQTQASLESARAQERNARSNYERVRQLYENNNASRTDLDAARAGFESASAQVKALSKQLQLARLQLEYCNLKVPVDGAIASVDVEVNENISAGRTIVQLSSGANIEVEVAIPEILISKVREGQPVTVNFDAIPGTNFSAKVTEVGVSATGFATTYPATVLLESSENEIRPGMAAEVAFQFSTEGERERLVVPSVAVGEDRNGRFVFTVETSDEDGVGTVKRRLVVIGDFTEDGIEIFEGLADGSHVITAGMSKLSDGMRVQFELE